MLETTQAAASGSARRIAQLMRAPRLVLLVRAPDGSASHYAPCSLAVFFAAVLSADGAANLEIAEYYDAAGEPQAQFVAVVQAVREELGHIITRHNAARRAEGRAELAAELAVKPPELRGATS